MQDGNKTKTELIAELRSVENHGTGVIRMEMEIPTRGLIGYRTEFMTDTRGLGIMAARYIGYGPWKGEIGSRNRGARFHR